MTDTFTGELWHGVTGIYEAILKHPFLTGLADGSLPDEMFARHAADAIAVEKTLHGSLLSDLGHGSFAEGVGAVLPCYWIYWEVGKELRRRGSPDPRFQRWIDTYSGADYGDYVQEVLDLTNRLGAGLSEDERARLHGYFRTSSRYEWMFWDMGYRMEGWPIGA